MKCQPPQMMVFTNTDQVSVNTHAFTDLSMLPIVNIYFFWLYYSDKDVNFVYNLFLQPPNDMILFHYYVFNRWILAGSRFILSNSY